ncbi:hypothetical protein C9374_013368 [Naegleria lovaniensis]|uniref:Radial spokehead-like protein n=1 Tax=Naegleria lovaniensis TaxID=51637 RepID=A0AA88KNA2_NAELO|nr:uncharacterized protein C9374_013368 [Naegleria lovaniensis]KAG2391883.1 hypothetical protein C9374_013368 [Naegleria lovaniensis]
MSTTTPQTLFEEAKAYLQITNEHGKSIYDMLIDIVTYLQNHKNMKEINLRSLLQNLSEDSFKYGERAGFEELWRLAKPNSESCIKARDVIGILSNHKEQMEQEFSKRREELRAINAKKDEENNEEAATEENPEDKNFVYSNPDGLSNLIEDFYALSNVGISLPYEEISMVQIALKTLKKSKNLNYVRFFGKVFGTQSNYYVFESNYHFEEKQPEDNIHESSGKPGINRFTYWVLSSRKSEHPFNFVKLPDVTPEQIQVAREITKLFTGDLNRAINSYPVFPGNEANYLRAQIARIVHASTLAPMGLFEERELPAKEEDEEDEENKKKQEIKFKEQLPPLVKVKEGFELKNPEDMKSFENWVHLYPGILKTGYVTKEKQEGDESEEGDKDPVIPSLRSLQEDEPLKRCKTVQLESKKKQEEEEEENENEGEKDKLKTPSWKVAISNHRKQTCHHKSFRTVLLSSLRWPGAYSFYRLTGPTCHFGNVYIGYGVKSSGIPFTPQFPPAVVEDSKEPVDQTDPKPNDVKRMLQGLEPTSEETPQEAEDEARNGDEEDEEEQ